jgi:CBS-domain-containing membrane protein
LPVVTNEGILYGIVTSRQLLNFLTSYKLALDQSVKKAIVKDYKVVKMTDSLKYLSKAFTRYTHVVITDDKDYYICDHKTLLNSYLNK